MKSMNHDSSCLESYTTTIGDICIRQRAADLPVPDPEPPCDDQEIKNLSDQIASAYEEIVGWRKNLFEVPTCAVGRRFVRELASWLENFNARTKYREFAITSFIILPALLLQKPSAKSKLAEHKELLQKRLDLWEKGEIQELLQSGRSIQKRLIASQKKGKEEDTARKFSNLMFEGKVNAAVRMVCEQADKGVLPLNKDTLDQLKKKHPSPAGIMDKTLLFGPVRKIDPQYFHAIDGGMIFRAAKMTNGGAGPSGTNSDFFFSTSS